METSDQYSATNYAYIRKYRKCCELGYQSINLNLFKIRGGSYTALQSDSTRNPLVKGGKVEYMAFIKGINYTHDKL